MDKRAYCSPRPGGVRKLRQQRACQQHRHHAGKNSHHIILCFMRTGNLRIIARPSDRSKTMQRGRSPLILQEQHREKSMAMQDPFANSRELAGQVALVTGGAKNIGRAISLALAAAGAAASSKASSAAGRKRKDA